MSRENFAKNFIELLKTEKLIGQKEANDLLITFFKSSSENFEDFLLESGLISKENLLKALSLYYKIPAFDATGYMFEHEILKEFPKDVMLRNRFIPITIDNDIMVVATSQPDNDNLEVTINKHVPNEIKFNVGLRRDIEDAIKEYYDKAVTLQEDIDSDDTAYEWVERDELRHKTLDESNEED